MVAPSDDDRVTPGRFPLSGEPTSEDVLAEPWMTTEESEPFGGDQGEPPAE